MKLKDTGGLPIVIINKIIDAMHLQESDINELAATLQKVIGNDYWVYAGSEHIAIHRETGKTCKGERLGLIA